MTRRHRTLVLSAIFLASGFARAEAERPRTRDLILAGAAMAPPSYFVGVLSHEGSHALAGKLFGAEVAELHLLPGWYGPGRDFHFGYVRVRGYLSPGEKTFFWLAPKITDTIMVGSYSLALALDAVPENRYGRLALVVFATGFWVDFSKDMIAFWDSNDVVKAYQKNGLDSELSRLPFRLLHVGLSVAGAYALFRGYQGVFEAEEDPAAPLVVPIFTTSF